MKIAISKQTTFLEGPLRPDGTVDYAAALNERFGAGVTPENNAAVPFWQAVGPKEINEDLRPQYFECLGIAALPEEGPYLVPLVPSEEFGRLYKAGDAGTAEFERRWGEVSRQVEIAWKRPWREAEFPALAEWLKSNQQPLDVLVEGVRRPRFFSPLVFSEGKSLWAFDERMIHMQSAREAREQLLCRAMLRLGSNQVDNAWEDLLTVHRLARHLQQMPFWLDHLPALAMNCAMSAAEARFAYYANLTAAQATNCRADLQSLPPLAKMADAWGLGERLESLDCALALRQSKWPPTQKDILDNESESADIADLMHDMMARWKVQVEAMKRISTHPRVDWNEVLRWVNIYHDWGVAAYQHATFVECRNSLRAAAWEIDRRYKAIIGRRWLTKLLATCAPARKISFDLATVIAYGHLMTKFGDGCNTAFTVRMRAALTDLAFALAAYRSDHGEYPATLPALRPQYIAEIPKDLFTDGELIYKRQEEGYLLYSLGPNGKDDGGAHHCDDAMKYIDVPFDQWPENITIRVPPEAGKP